MSLLRPFKALRPTPEAASHVASVPYDVVSTEEAAALAREHPVSFLHVTRSEIDLPRGTDPYSDAVYQKALENFRALRDDAPLVTEQAPCIYIYRLAMGDHVQIGIAATFSIDEYDNNQIKKHEKTRKDKEDDRTRHILTLMAQTGPVFLAYRARPDIDSLVKKHIETHPPLFNFVAPDHVTHRLWRVDDPAPFVAAFAQVPALYIADGHHRAASASRVRQVMRDEYAGGGSSKAPRTWTGQEDANFFLAVAFPDTQCRILPYHRVVRDLDGFTRSTFLEALHHQVTIEETDLPSPEAPGAVHMYLPGQWYRLGLQGSFEHIHDPLASLDVNLLQNRVLKPLLKIDDPRTDKRIDFVGGIRGTSSLMELVDGGKFAVAFSMFATSLEQLFAIADAGEIMPPKSTWFEPKLRDAMVINVI